MNESSRQDRIVVGLDQTPSSRAALQFALREGVVRGATVHVVTAWLFGASSFEVVDGAQAEEAALEVHLAQDEAIVRALDELQERPDVTRLVVRDVGGQTLIDEARNAVMLVIGRGSKNPLGRAFLGSVGEFCVRHATVPVVVVPAPSRVG